MKKIKHIKTAIWILIVSQTIRLLWSNRNGLCGSAWTKSLARINTQSMTLKIAHRHQKMMHGNTDHSTMFAHAHCRHTTVCVCVFIGVSTFWYRFFVFKSAFANSFGKHTTGWAWLCGIVVVFHTVCCRHRRAAIWVKRKKEQIVEMLLIWYWYWHSSRKSIAL